MRCRKKCRTSVRNGQAGTISDHDLFSTVVWVVKSKIVEVCRKMMCRSAIEEPVVGIVCCRRRQMCTRLPWSKGGGRLLIRVSIASMKVKLRTCPSTVAMNTTYLTPSLIWSWRVTLVVGVFPAVVPNVVVRATVVGSAMATSVVVVMATVARSISRNRNG